MPMRSWSQPLRRHPVVTALGALVLLLAVVFAVCEWRGWPFLRAPLERTLSQRLDREVRIGERFSLHLLGALKLRSDSLSLGPPRWAADERGGRFVDAQDVYLEVPWGTLWNVAVAHEPKPLRISAVEVGSFDANLWRREDKRANWEFQLAADDRPDRPRTEPEFGRLLVRNGRLTLQDVPSQLTLRAVAQTSEGLDAGPDAGLQIRGDGRYRDGDFQFNMQSNGVLPLVAGQGDTTPVKLSMNAKTPDGRIRFNGEARDVVRLQALSGQFQVSGTSLARVGGPFGITLPTTAPFESEGRLGKQGEVWKAQFERFDVGSSRLAGDFAFDRSRPKPLLTGTLRGRNLDLADLGPAFGTPAPGSGNPPKPAGRLFPEREFNIPSLQAMNADVRVDLQRADLHTAKLEPFTPLKGRVALTDGVLRLDELIASTAGGEIRGRLVLDGRQPKAPKWDGDLRIAGVSLEQWLNVKNEQAATPQQAAVRNEKPATSYIAGRLGGHLKFTGRGDSIAEMVSTLDGTLTAWVNEGRVSHLVLEAAGIDVAQALGVLVKGDDSLAMQCAATQFTARDGALTMDVGIVDTRDTTMLLQGQVSLDDERMNLVTRAYPKDFSIAALRSPIHVEGALNKPKVRLEAKPLAAKAGAAVLLGAAVSPLAALIPLIDPGKKAPVGCDQALAALRGTNVRHVEPPKVQAAGTERAPGRRDTARAPAQATAGQQVGEQPSVPKP